MSVGPLSLDPNAEARALLNFMLRHGDIVGIDHAGHTILQLAADPWTLDQLAAFDADATDLEDSDSEPDCPAVILDLVPPKRVSRGSRIAQALALALLLVTGPQIEARADEASVVAPLPMSTAQAPQQCCRMCRKGEGLRRRLHQRREAVQEGAGLRVLGGWQSRGRGMTEADQLLLKIRVC